MAERFESLFRLFTGSQANQHHTLPRKGKSEAYFSVMQDWRRVKSRLFHRACLLELFDLLWSGVGGAAYLLPCAIRIAMLCVYAELGYERPISGEAVNG